VGMLRDFINRHELDIVLLQEVTDHTILETFGYNIYHNIGSTKRGTAIMAKTEYNFTHVTKLPSGRALTDNLDRTRFKNMYAPSGTAKRTERERFFTTELPATSCRRTIHNFGGATLTACYRAVILQDISPRAEP
jgi:exonuclease III